MAGWNRGIGSLSGLLGVVMLGACGPAGEIPYQEATPTLEPTTQPTLTPPTPTASPTSTASPPPTAPPTVAPTATAPPTPTVIPTPTLTPDPNATPEPPTPTPPEPTATLAPTPTATATPTAAPTPTARPTEPPEPTAPPDLAGTGSVPGKIAYDFNLRDATNTRHSLYQYYNDVILLDFSAEWCGNCRALARDHEELYQDYKSQGFQMITILIQNQSGGNPTTSTCANWADDYDLTFPVLADENQETYNQYLRPVQPGFFLIDREMVILEAWESPPNDVAIRAAIEDAL